uniref:Uncharacterized protein n=1 Tax=Solanum tuberosum TaxID=4113 RepID=M1DJT2_SOLTU
MKDRYDIMLRVRIVLIALSHLHQRLAFGVREDYVNLLSKPQFYITHNYWSDPMRILKWKSNFDLEEETTTAIVWISLPALPPNFLGKEHVFSMAATTVVQEYKSEGVQE